MYHYQIQNNTGCHLLTLIGVDLKIVQLRNTFNVAHIHYKLNCSEPKIDPWETTDETLTSCEEELPVLT